MTEPSDGPLGPQSVNVEAVWAVVGVFQPSVRPVARQAKRYEAVTRPTPASRYQALYEGTDLLAVTVYKRGARAVMQRLQALDQQFAEQQALIVNLAHAGETAVTARRRSRPSVARLGAVILAARKAAGLSQTELAAKLKTAQANVVRLEKGRTRPSTRTLERIAKATGHKLVISFSR